MIKTFHVKISLPNKICIDKDCVSVNMPTSLGYITILHDHSSIIGAVTPGYLTITYEDGSKFIGLINYGIYQCKKNQLNIMSDFFEKNDDVNSDAIDSINQIISKAVANEDMVDRTASSLNSYTKLITAKAAHKKEN